MEKSAIQVAQTYSTHELNLKREREREIVR